jgi:hypothetical protein
MPWQSGLTANHCYRTARNGRRYLSPEAKAWRFQLAYVLKNALIRCRDWHATATTLTIRSDWFSPQEPDQDNRSKLIADAVQMATGINDKNFTIEPGAWERAKGQDAHISITVSWD